MRFRECQYKIQTFWFRILSPSLCVLVAVPPVGMGSREGRRTQLWLVLPTQVEWGLLRIRCTWGPDRSHLARVDGGDSGRARERASRGSWGLAVYRYACQPVDRQWHLGVWWPVWAWGSGTTVQSLRDWDLFLEALGNMAAPPPTDLGSSMSRSILHAGTGLRCFLPVAAGTGNQADQWTAALSPSDTQAGCHSRLGHLEKHNP